MAIHHPILCTFRLWSASLQVASPRALQLECKFSTDKLIITQKLGAAPTPPRHRNKHDNNIVTIGPKGEVKNKGKHPMHLFAPRPTSGGSTDSGHHHKGAPARPIMPIHHQTNIDRHLWESDLANLPDDIVGSLEATPNTLLKNQLFFDTQVKVSDDFHPRDNSTHHLSEGLKEVSASTRSKKRSGYGVPGAPPKLGDHEPKRSIYIDNKLISKGVPEWFILEMLNELTKCSRHWNNKHRPRTMFKVYSDREKMKVVQQARQSEEASNRQLEEEVQLLGAKQKVRLGLVSKLQADIVALHQQKRPRSPSHPIHPPHPSHSPGSDFLE